MVISHAQECSRGRLGVSPEFFLAGSTLVGNTAHHERVILKLVTLCQDYLRICRCDGLTSPGSQSSEVGLIRVFAKDRPSQAENILPEMNKIAQGFLNAIVLGQAVQDRPIRWPTVQISNFVHRRIT